MSESNVITGASRGLGLVEPRSIHEAASVAGERLGAFAILWSNAGVCPGSPELLRSPRQSS